MRIDDRERAILINDRCKRIGSWADQKIYNAFSSGTLQSIREDAERLIELLDARELSMMRKQGLSPKRDSEEEG
jgi:hypothetical protein